MQQESDTSKPKVWSASDRAEISDAEFRKFKAWIYEAAGISLSDHKKALVMGRLAPRMRYHQLEKYGDYFDLLTSKKHSVELQIAIDLLTTNETYFFREPKHFDFLREEILKDHRPGRQVRIWSAASSTGEEPYTLSMILSDCLGNGPWDIVASDLSSRVLERARSGHYSMERARHIPKPYLRKYCLKGVKDQEGTFMIDDALKRRIKFMQINLNEPLPNIGEFDVIFIRNVMIYFDMETKRQVIERLIPLLKKGGYLIIGHSESLNGITENVDPLRPSIYRKP
jgi:chemotaxis protein methyltransferase CheR